MSAQNFHDVKYTEMTENFEILKIGEIRLSGQLIEIRISGLPEHFLSFLCFLNMIF